MIQILWLYGDLGLLLLRIVAGIIFLAHGLPKIKDLKATGAMFGSMGFKPGSFWGPLVAIVEVFGGLMLVTGLFTQLAALALAVNMAVAAVWKLRNKQKLVGGYELDLILLAALLTLAATGSMALSIDNYFGIILY